MAREIAFGRFKVGDTVILKSGGPDMTVVQIVGISNDRAMCSWFAGKKNESGNFPFDALNAKQVSNEATDNSQA